MKWIKHLTAAGSDPVMIDLMERYGAAGYGIWWRLVELIGREIKTPQDPPQVRMLLATWARLSGARTGAQFNRVVSFLESSGKADLEWSGDYLIISIPNILKYCDEWIRKGRSKSGPAPDKLRTNSSLRSRIEVEEKRLKDLDLGDLGASNGAQAPTQDQNPTPPPPETPPETPPKIPGNGLPPRDKCARPGCNRRGSTKIAGKWYCTQDALDVDTNPVSLGTILSDNDKFLNQAQRS